MFCYYRKGCVLLYSSPLPAWGVRMVPGWVLGTLCITGQLAHQEQARHSWCWVLAGVFEQAG